MGDRWDGRRVWDGGCKPCALHYAGVPPRTLQKDYTEGPMVLGGELFPMSEVLLYGT